MQCSKCDNPYIVNKTHNLCFWCNHIRLHNETPIEAKIRKEKGRNEAKYQKGDLKLKKRIGSSKKRKTVLIKDRELYRRVFLKRNCQCEECAKALPTEFEGESGNIVAIWRYSHILTKGAYPEYRHCDWNINILCLKCHSKWETGNRKSMRVYNKNKETILKETGRGLL